MGLEKYKQKRDLEKSHEPKAEVGQKKDKNLTYVVQKHHAQNLHYDLRLEHEGVLWSWAVPKKPSDSGIKRLAIRTEDHPLDYAGFEGEIPKGHYGAGRVKIWDKGFWEPEDIKKNKIVFKIKGDRLNGKFVLINLKDQEKNWLFFKVGD